MLFVHFEPCIAYLVKYPEPLFYVVKLQLFLKDGHYIFLIKVIFVFEVPYNLESLEQKNKKRNYGQG